MDAVKPAIREAASELREALADAVSPQIIPPFRPVDLHRVFGVDRRLGWEVSKLMQDADVFAAARQFPGQVAMRRFLRAVSETSKEEHSIQRCQDAIEHFESLITELAGDRGRFDLMLASLSEEEGSAELLAQRRAAFESNRFIYGAEAAVHLRTRVLMPSVKEPGMIDIASVGGLLELRRLRPECAWPVYVRRWHDATGQSQGPTNPHSISPPIGGADADEVPLLRSYCTPQDIRIERDEVEPGLVEYVLPAGSVGLKGSVSCLLGEVFEAVGPRYSRPGDEYVDFNTRVATPAEQTIVDTLIHKDLLDLGKPELLLRNEVAKIFRGRNAWSDADNLEPLSAPMSLGIGPAGVGLVEVRWYAAMVRDVLGLLGQDPDAFETHRVAVPYPPLGSTITVRYRLIDPDDTGGPPA